LKKTVIVLLIIYYAALMFYLWASDKPTTTVFPAPVTVQPIPTPTPIPVDPREANLAAFFTARKCPDINFSLIPDYLAVADQYNLDWRILPAISVQESSCLQYYPVAITIPGAGQRKNWICELTKWNQFHCGTT